MNFLTKIALVSGLGLATVASAQATDPNVIARQTLMKTIGMNTKILGDMAGGKTAFDAATAEAAKAALVAAAADIPAKYQVEAMDADTKAKPEIWANWDDFVAKGAALGTAAGAIDIASAETIAVGLQAVGGSCSACHQTYRVTN